MLLVVISVINVSAVARFVLRPGADCRSRLPILHSPHTNCKQPTSAPRPKVAGVGKNCVATDRHPLAPLAPPTWHGSQLAPLTSILYFSLPSSLFSRTPDGVGRCSFCFCFAVLCCAVLCAMRYAVLCFVLFCFCSVWNFLDATCLACHSPVPCKM